jgi:hypothetical protein
MLAVSLASKSTGALKRAKSDSRNRFRTPGRRLIRMHSRGKSQHGGKVVKALTAATLTTNHRLDALRSPTCHARLHPAIELHRSRLRQRLSREIFRSAGFLVIDG